jgi:hypothetical protein
MALIPSDERRRRPSLTQRREIREFARYLTSDRRELWIVYKQIDNRGEVSEVIRRIEEMPLPQRVDLIRHIAESMRWTVEGSLEEGGLQLESPLVAELKARAEGNEGVG